MANKNYTSLFFLQPNTQYTHSTAFLTTKLLVVVVLLRSGSGYAHGSAAAQAELVPQVRACARAQMQSVAQERMDEATRARLIWPG